MLSFENFVVDFVGTFVESSRCPLPSALRPPSPGPIFSNCTRPANLSRQSQAKEEAQRRRKSKIVVAQPTIYLDLRPAFSQVFRCSTVIYNALVLSLVLVCSALIAGCKRFEPKTLSPKESAASFENRSLDDPGLKEFAEEFTRPAPDSWPPAQWDFPALTVVAFYYHPALDLARAQWNVAKASIKTAGGRPNPILTVAPGYSMNPASGLSPWFPLASLDLPVETAGKRGYRISHAQKLSEAARLNIASAAWQVRSNLRLALLDYSAAQQRADLLQMQLQIQQQMVTLLEQRLQAGAATRNELTLPRLAQARLGVDFADATRLAAEARVRIADALGLPAKAIADAKLPTAPPVSVEAGKELTTDEARQQALLGRPDVLAALAEYGAIESLLQLEIARQFPDIHLNPGYQFDQGEHKWSLGLSAELPVLNQNQGPIAETRAKRQESAARFVELQAKVIADIDRALAARAAALDQVTRQGQLTQLASEQSAAAEAMFNAGASDKLELSSAQLEASASNLAYLDAQIRAQQAVAQLEDAIQRPLQPWPALERGRSAKVGESLNR